MWHKQRWQVHVVCRLTTFASVCCPPSCYLRLREGRDGEHSQSVTNESCRDLGWPRFGVRIRRAFFCTLGKPIPQAREFSDAAHANLAGFMYGFYYHFNNLHFNKTTHK